MSRTTPAPNLIAALETNLQCMVDEQEKAANDMDTEAKNAQNRIIQLEVQCKNWEEAFLHQTLVHRIGGGYIKQRLPLTPTTIKE